MTGFHRLFLRVWWGLPFDGAAVLPLGPAEVRRLRRAIARFFWRRVPGWSGPFLVPTARAAWFLACPVRAILAISGAPAAVSIRDLVSAVWLGWSRGKTPEETLRQRARIGSDGRASVRTWMVANSLDLRQGRKLFHALNDPADEVLAVDKLVMTERLGAIGVPVAPILAVIEPAQIVDLKAAPWSNGERLFVKPRRGSSAYGAFSVQPLTGGTFAIDNGPPMTAREFAMLLVERAQEDSLLVQRFLYPSRSTQDISPQAPAWLRIFVVRSPEGAVRVFSGALKILPPRQYAETDLDRILFSPVDPDHGVLMDGILLSRPQERFANVPWNDAPLRGRFLPEWQAACAACLRASVLLPGSVVVGWDAVLSADGVVILEANHGVPWSTIELWHFETGTPSPLVDVMLRWVEKVVADT